MGMQNVKKLKYNIIPLLKHNTMNDEYCLCHYLFAFLPTLLSNNDCNDSNNEYYN